MRPDRNGKHGRDSDDSPRDDNKVESGLHKVLAVRRRVSEYSSNHGFAEVLRKTIHELCELTGSTIGFYRIFAALGLTEQSCFLVLDSTEDFGQIKEEYSPSGNALPERWSQLLTQGKSLLSNDPLKLSSADNYPAECDEIQRELIIPVCRDGVTVAILGVANSSLDYQEEDAECVAILADLVWDIVWVKHLEEERQKSGSSFAEVRVEQSLLDNIHLHMPIGFALLDNEWRLHWPNRQLSLITGYSLEELEGMPVRLLYLSEEKYQRVLRAKVESLSRTGTSEIETEWIRKDGEQRNVVLNAICKDPGNPSAGLIGTIQDITQSHLAIKALRQSEEQYKLIFENAVAGIFQSTPEGRFLSVNRAFADMLGYDSPDELIETITNISTQYYVNPDDRLRYQEILNQTGRVENFEFMVKRRDGSEIAVSNNTYAYFGDNGRIIFYEGMLIDITERKVMEEELTRIFSMSIDMICIADIQTASFLKVNPAFTHILGYSEEELIGRPFIKYVHPDDVDKTIAVVQDQLLAGAKVIDFENRYRCKSGSYRWLSWVSHPDEKQEKTYAVARDITDWKRAQEKLSENKALLDFTGRMARIGGWEMDADTMKVTWTEETYRIHEVPVGLQPPLEDAINFFHPDDRHKLTKAIEHALADGTPYDMEARFITAKGKRLWTRTKCEPNLVDGRVAKLRGVFQDITLRKQAEEQLEKQNRLMSTLLDNLQVGVFMVEAPSGKTLLANRKAKELLGRGIAENTNTSTLAEVYQAYKYGTNEIYPTEELPIFRAMHGEDHSVSDMVIHHPDGRKVHLHVFGSPVRDKDGKVAASLVSFFDISDQKRSEEERELLQHQLAKSQKMESIGRLTGGVAHDFNNILGVIIGYTEMALESVHDEDPLHDDLGKIYDAAMRSSDIVRQLLAFSRQQPISPRILDLNETVEGMLKMLRHLIGEDIELAWHPAQDMAKVKMDPSQVDQILANLCVNARDAINGTGKIIISTGMTILSEDECLQNPEYFPGTFVKLSVQDDGSGMEEERLENIFEPFFTTKEVGKGTGLGLATVYGIAKQNNGFVKVVSELGKGSTFNVLLPAIDSHGIDTKDELETSAKSGRGETILVVEDESAVLDMTVSVLERAQYIVIAANSPLEAIGIARNRSLKIDLVLSDIVMPEMNGKELAAALQEECPDLKVLFMSGYTDDVISNRGVLGEDVNFIQKPFTRNELTSKIDEILNS